MGKNNRAKNNKKSNMDKNGAKGAKGTFVGKKMPAKNNPKMPVVGGKNKKKAQKQVEVAPESSSEDEEEQEEGLEEANDDNSEESETEVKVNTKAQKVAPQVEAPADSSDDDDEPDDDDDDDNEDEESDKENHEEDDEDQEEADDDSDEEIANPQPKKVKVANSAPKSAPTGSNHEENAPSLRCFISNLSKNTNDDSLRQLFVSKDLSVTDCFIPGGSFGPKGYAFVEFETAQMASTAIGMSGQTLDGNEISITYAKPKRGPAGAPAYSDSKETNILIVKNLAPNATKEMLESCFKGADDIRVLANPDGSCKGQAFIEYSTSEAAKAVKDSDPPSVGGARVMLDFAAPRGANRFNRGGFSRGRGGFNRDRDDDFGGRRGGSFRGGDRDHGGVGKFGGGRGFRGGDRGGFRGRSGFGGDRRGGSRGSFGGNRGFRGSRVQFDDD